MKLCLRPIEFVQRNLRIASRGLVLIASLLFVCASTAFCQTETAAVLGTVTDSTGAIVPGATVTLKNLGTGVSRTATTSGSGDYAFDLLQVGAYSVTVSAN